MIAFSRGSGAAKPSASSAISAPTGIASARSWADAGAAQPGQKGRCWNQDPIPRSSPFSIRKSLMQQPGTGPAIRLRDRDGLRRVSSGSGRSAECIQERKLFINIDHHESNTRYADINWVSPKEPSTGELIFRLLKAANWPITPRFPIACLPRFRRTRDRFSIRRTRPATYHVAGELVKRGANLARDLRRSLSILSVVARAAAQAVYNRFRLTHKTRSPISG